MTNNTLEANVLVLLVQTSSYLRMVSDLKKKALSKRVRTVLSARAGTIGKPKQIVFQNSTLRFTDEFVTAFSSSRNV
jgi:hypothetical protein